MSFQVRFPTVKCGATSHIKYVNDAKEAAARLLNEVRLYLNVRAQFREAEPLLQRALAISEAGLGANHPDVAQSLNNLGGLYYAQGRYEEGEPLHQRALSIREQELGANHPDVAQSLNNLAEIYRVQRYERPRSPLQLLAKTAKVLKYLFIRIVT